MTAQSNLSTPTITINGTVTAIVPNSFNYTEGLGEQNVFMQSLGGKSVQLTKSADVESTMSKVEFQVRNTLENIEFYRQVKENFTGNVVTISAINDQGVIFSRTINDAILTSDYQVNLGADTPMDIVFMGSPAV